MPFRISIVKTVALLLLSACSTNAVNLRGQVDPKQPAPGQPNQAANGKANPSPDKAMEKAAASYFKNAAKSLGADQTLAALGEHVSLQKRIIQSMQNLNQKMASLAMKNDQLQRLEADDQLNRLSALPPEMSENSRFQSAPVGTPSAISLMHPVMPFAQTVMPPAMIHPGSMQGMASSNSNVSTPRVNPDNNPMAWMSYNSFGSANIPLPQPHVTQFFGGHSLGYPIPQGSAVREVGLPSPNSSPQIAQLPPYAVNMVSGSSYYDQKGYPSSVYQVPGATNGNTVPPAAQGAHLAHPLWMSAQGYPLVNPRLGYSPHGAMAPPYAGVRGLSPAFAMRGLPLDVMGYPVTVLGLNSPPPPPRSGAPSGSGSGAAAF